MPLLHRLPQAAKMRKLEPIRPKATELQPALRLTPEQIDYIKPLLVNERPSGLPNLIIAQVRSMSYPETGQVEIAFAMVDYQTGREILGLIERSRNTRYAPGGSFANFVEILPQGEPVFVLKDRRKKREVVTTEAPFKTG